MNTKGFTIIESLISVTVLTLSITGATTIVNESLRSAAFVKAQGQAVGLAVEGVEYAQNIHDVAELDGQLYEVGTDFYDFVNDCAQGCAFNTRTADDSGSVTEAGHERCMSDCHLNISDTGYVRANRPSDQSVRYERQLRSESKSIDGGHEVKVVSEVDFTVRGRAHSVSFDSYQFLQEVVVEEEEE